MDDKSQSLLFLVFILIFFLAPPLLKLLGQYTLKSRPPRDTPVESPPTEAIPGEESEHPETMRPGVSEVQNKPITPRWF